MLSFTSGAGNTLTSVANYAGTASGTITCWIRPTAISGTKDFFQRGTGVFRFQQVNASFRCRIMTSSYTTQTSAVVSDTTYHFAIVWSPSGGNTINSFYLNGVADGTGTNGTGALTAGTLTVATGGWDGYVEDLRIYDRALAVDEIQCIYSCQGRDNIIYGLHNRWIMAETQPGSTASGTGTVVDIGADQNNFTPASSPVYRDSVIIPKRRTVIY